MQSNVSDTVQRGVSRRGFLKGALLGGAALTMSSRLALAQQMATGRITAENIRGVGVEPGLVRMALNENPIGPSRRALQAIADNMFDINRYGFNQMPLIQALADYDGVELPKPPERGAGGPGGGGGDGGGAFGGGGGRRMPLPYMMSAGSGQILEVLALTYLSKGGAEVIEAELGYGDISRTAEDYNRMGIPTNVIKVPMTRDYKHDLAAMQKAITPKTTMVVITNPNNPTGTLLSYAELENFVNAVPKSVIIVLDEAYIHFARDPNYKRAIPLAIANENVIVVRTFSKVYAMPAMRLGYAVCSPKIQQALRFYMTGSPNLLAQVAGAAAVLDLDHVRESQQVVWDFRDRCYAEFKKMGLEYIPGEGNFFMVNIGRDSMPVLRELFKRRVMVTNRTRETMPNWIRVSSGTQQETEVFLNELKDILSSAS